MKSFDELKLHTLHLFAYLVGIYAVVTHFSVSLLIVGILLGMVVSGVGVSVSLHRMSAHSTFAPKNRFIKLVLMFIGVLASMGSNMAWAAVHRVHHANSDREGDPHSPQTGKANFWHSVKIWAFFNDYSKVRPGVVRDLMLDKDYMFFHKHYYKILSAYIALLLAIDPIYAGYIYGIPVIYALNGALFKTVIFHSKWFMKWFGYQTFNVNDTSCNNNSMIMKFISFGECYHNNHHRYPGSYILSVNSNEFDFGAKIIEVIGVPKRKYDTKI